MTKIAEIDGRKVRLSNLDKVLYPVPGFTKGEVLHYYTRIAEVLLPHLHDRPASFLRFPEGVDGERFFAKNVPPGAPDWVRTADVPTKSSTVHHVLVQDLSTLLWAANLAVEIHVPQWRVTEPGVSDRIVFDLDPGPPATVVECCRAALLVREALAEDGLDAWPKTSGSKGLHLYVPIEPAPAADTSAYAKALAVRLEERSPELVLHRMAKELRRGKVFVDWSQNNRAKTTVAPYVIRARERPTVSTPLDWDEVGACAKPEDLVFLPDEVAERVEEYGDLLAPLFEERYEVPG
ncbi:Multifunctional non-homologous end joining protein LigD [Streptomyces sp. RB5]|uniref:Multifunctional non-homologous end joining protein LigD n=1 Tax=Streptomyces smaragdinus TaxID=2585196 RepID=A0A7K0CCZ6_9ACTN|nr:non-homologous end-joining DNA ligase [Streptomyces smaragdinus]MQY11213.1 Multifunctional non-homologous end joining protein LigD [Streptomyces smaragdinus]